MRRHISDRTCRSIEFGADHNAASAWGGPAEPDRNAPLSWYCNEARGATLGATVGHLGQARVLSELQGHFLRQHEPLTAAHTSFSQKLIPDRGRFIGKSRDVEMRVGQPTRIATFCS